MTPAENPPDARDTPAGSPAQPATGALGGGCCLPVSSCVFAKALLTRAAVCELVQRHARADGEALECPRPTARGNCALLLALLRERARFALRLPGPDEPMVHAKALRLQCGALQGLQQALGEPTADVHRMIGRAQQRHGSLAELPFDALVRSIAEWQPHRPRRGGPR